MFDATPSRKLDQPLVGAAPQFSNRRKLFLAMLVLFATLIVVLIRDGQLWLSNDAPPEVADNWVGPAGLPQDAVRAQAVTAAAAAKHLPVRTAEKASAEPAIVATDRVPLPPLDIKVVSANNGTVQLSDSPSVDSPAQMANVSERVTSSGMAADHTIVAEYPLLAQQMKIQGSVLMQALIGADGVIEELRVISGPAILSMAARQAVMQYHFKPFLQDGQAAETSARITVNFAIKVLDASTRTPGGSLNNGGF
jgi:TonB family protein